MRPAIQLALDRVVPLSVAGGLLASAGLGLGIAHALPEPTDTLPLSEVKPGMKGYGLTVFSGTTPEKFDIEVISTLHNFRPNQDLVLVKTLHPRLEVAKTVAGMSGSPIYLNGKMIGAYAYGWLFGAEAIAGVTPIKSMLDELARPIPKNLFPRGASPLVSHESEPQAAAAHSPSIRAFRGAPEDYDLAKHGRELATRTRPGLDAPTGTTLAPASTPILLGGMGQASMKVAANLLAPMGLDPLQAGGGSSSNATDAPDKYVDGGAIGVELVRGDISAMGLGTVTRVSGGKLVAFGHPMLGGGVEALPTAIGKVHWILASQNRSFKIGEAVRSRGALVNDRQAAIVVDESVKAPTFPVRIDIQGVPGVPKHLWNVEVAHDQFLSPSFTAMAIGSALEETTAERRDVTWRATTKIQVAGHGAVTVSDFGAGAGNPLTADDMVRSRAVRALGALLNNPWEPTTIAGVETTIRMAFQREVSTLRGAKVLETEVDAGSPVRVRLELEAFQGKSDSRVIEIPIPHEFVGREVEIDLAPGYDVERPLPTADNVDELIANLPNATFDPESIVASFRLRESGAAYKGKLASRLPPGAVDQLRTSSQSDAPEVFAAVSHFAVPLHRFVVGHDTIRVQVRPVMR